MNLLEDLVKPEKELANFDYSNYKNPQKFELYFDELTEGKSADDVEMIMFYFENTHDGIREYFAKYIPEIISLVRELDYELSYEEENSLDDFSLENVEKSETVDSTDFDFPPVDDDDWGVIDENWNLVDDETLNNGIVIEEKEEIITEENLRKYLKFINSAFELSEYHELGIKMRNYLYNLVNKKRLEEFYSNPEFCKDYDLIMSHDKKKNIYYFHGTQCLEDAGSIIEQGLGMMRSELSSTAYREFTKDELILYSRGFGGEIGREAVVILDAPIVDGKEINIVEKNDFQTELNFSPSGLQGLDGKSNYIVKPENIVGYVDKLNKKVVFNPKYRNYKAITMLQQMELGNLDTNGQPVIPEDTNTDIKTKGFIKVGSLSIITILISIGILVLGIILIK